MNDEIEFRQLANTLPQLVWKTDAKGKQVFASTRWEEYTGLNPLDEATFERIVHPDDYRGINEAWTSCLATGNAYKYEVRLKSKTGAYRWFYVQGEPVPDTSGEILTWIGTFTDVHEQKIAEEELKRFKYMADHAREKFILLRSDGSLAYVNQLALQHWGYDQSEITHLKVIDIFPELDSEAFAKIFTSAQQNVVSPFETTHKRKNGTTYTVEVSMSGLMMDEKPHLFVVARDVTERKESLRKIRENEEKLQIVIDASELGTWEVDLVEKKINYSNQYLRVLGYDIREELTHDDLVRHLHPDNLAVRDKAYKEAYETGVLNYQTRVIWKDGSLHWVEGRGKVFFDGKQTPVKMVGTARDITTEKLHQQRIEESEQRFRTIADNAPVLIWMSETDKKRNFFNRAWLNFTGRSSSSEEGNVWAAGIHTDDRAHCEAIIQRAVEKREPFQMEYRLKRHDGEYRWLSDHGTPRYAANGTFEGFIGACMDVHERTLIEEILKTNERKFRLLADSMPQLIWTATPQGQFNYFNKSALKYSGVGIDELMTSGWFSIIHPDDADENIRKWKHAIESGESFLFEHRFKRLDGEYRWHLTRAVPQKEDKGEIVMWVGTSMDIHARKLVTDELEGEVNKRTRELNKLNQDLLKSNKELAQFAYVASHDLQEPLRKIKTFASQIMDHENQNLSDKGKDYFRRMQSAANRMQQFIIDLLSYSRASLNEKPFKETDLNTIVQTVQDQLKDVIESKKAVVQSDKLPTISVIPYQFEQLLTNLVSNAIKFSKADTTAHIKVTYEIVRGEEIREYFGNASAEFHHIAVVDNGIGFDQQYEDRIFQVFQRLHGKDEYPGTGIGLAICKRIIENHNGILNAVSQLDHGATFNVYLPRI